MKTTFTYEAQSGGVTATIRRGGAASLRLVTAPSGGLMYEDDGQSVTVGLALVIDLMRSAGYRVEEPKR